MNTGPRSTRPVGTSAVRLTRYPGAMALTWRRLGVPHQIAHWLATMDIGGPTTIRSPWALTAWINAEAAGFGDTSTLDKPCTFHRDRGNPLGDVSSPHNWVGFFDIALYALHLDRTDPMSPAHGEAFTAPCGSTTLSNRCSNRSCR